MTDIKAEICNQKNREIMVIDNASKMDYARHNFRPLKRQLIGKYSPAETHFENLLLESNYYFVREKTNFKFNTIWCYYDFYLPFYRIYIEIDGANHNSKEQKEVDEKKYSIIRKKHRYLVRLTNEEVLNMNTFNMEDIITHLCVQETLRNGNKKDLKRKIFKPKYYLKNLIENTENGLADMCLDTGIEYDLDEPIFMFCKRIGKIFKFRNIGILKINLQMRLRDVYENVTGGDDAQKRNFQYIYAYSQEECIDRVKRFMDIDLCCNDELDYTCELSEMEDICARVDMSDKIPF